MAQVFALTADRCSTECLCPEQVAPLIGRTLDGRQVAAGAALFGMLADPTRLRLLHALSLAEELCVSDLALLLGLSVSALSHQLAALRDQGVVSRRKVGRIVHYRLADEHVRHLLRDGLRHAAEPAVERDVAGIGIAAPMELAEAG